MGLLKCPDCDRDVSELAASCPNCGRPMQKRVSQNRYASAVTEPPARKGVELPLAIAVGVLVLALVYLLISRPSSVPTPTVETVANEAAETAATALAASPQASERVADNEEHRAYVNAMRSDLRNLQAQQEVYYADPRNDYSYAKHLDELPDFAATQGVRVTIVSADQQGYAARATHAAFGAARRCALFIGTGHSVAPARTAGEIICTIGD